MPLNKVLTDKFGCSDNKIKILMNLEKKTRKVLEGTYLRYPLDSLMLLSGLMSCGELACAIGLSAKMPATSLQEETIDRDLLKQNESIQRCKSNRIVNLPPRQKNRPSFSIVPPDFDSIPTDRTKNQKIKLCSTQGIYDFLNHMELVDILIKGAYPRKEPVRGELNRLAALGTSFGTRETFAELLRQYVLTEGTTNTTKRLVSIIRRLHRKGDYELIYTILNGLLALSHLLSNPPIVPLYLMRRVIIERARARTSQKVFWKPSQRFVDDFIEYCEKIDRKLAAQKKMLAKMLEELIIGGDESSISILCLGLSPLMLNTLSLVSKEHPKLKINVIRITSQEEILSRFLWQKNIMDFSLRAKINNLFEIRYLNYSERPIRSLKELVKKTSDLKALIVSASTTTPNGAFCQKGALSLLNDQSKLLENCKKIIFVGRYKMLHEVSIIKTLEEYEESNDQKLVPYHDLVPLSKFDSIVTV